MGQPSGIRTTRPAQLAGIGTLVIAAVSVS
jgi:hypothetical protein